MNRRLPLSGPIIFDCDGTLVATQRVWDNAYAVVCARHGAPLDDDDHSLVGLTLSHLGYTLARRFGLVGQHAQISAEIAEVVAANVGHAIAPLPGAVELVAALAGHRPLAVASNTPRDTVVEYLTTTGLLGAFDVVVGSDDVKHPKPAPDVYLAACARLGASPGSAIAIEDSPTGVASARAAGLYVIGVPSSQRLSLTADEGYASLADPHLRQTLRPDGRVVRTGR